jgi:hypothetical protein
MKIYARCNLGVPGFSLFDLRLFMRVKIINVKLVKDNVKKCGRKLQEKIVSCKKK